MPMGQNHKAVFVLTHLPISNFTRRSGHLRSSMIKFIQGEKQRYNCIELNSATTTNSYGIIFSFYLNITKYASCSEVIFGSPVLGDHNTGILVLCTILV